MIHKNLGDEPDNTLQWQSALGGDASVVNYTILLNISFFFVSVFIYTLLQHGGWSEKWSKVFSARRHLHPLSTVHEPPSYNYLDWVRNVLSVGDYEYMIR